MSDRNLLRDRTLILRIHDSNLASFLRDKITNLSNSLTSNQINDGKTFPLEGVTIEPSLQTLSQSISISPLQQPSSSSSQHENDPTLFLFHCDGATYPARLINLPNPIELHKTHDHAMFYKCVDIGQMLIVYEDMTALEEAESMPGYKVEGYPSYYHSGITPPLARVVERRFAAREHKAIPPPFSEVEDVERELLELIEKITTKTGSGGGAGSSSTSQKVLEEVVDEIVDYEPWMDNYGKKPKGIEFSETDDICRLHPELWLDPEGGKEEKEDQEDSSTKVKTKDNKEKDKNTSNSSTGGEKKKKQKNKDSTSEINNEDNTKGTTKKKKKKKKNETETETEPADVETFDTLIQPSIAEIEDEGVDINILDDLFFDTDIQGFEDMI